MFDDPERNGTIVLLLAVALWSFLTARLARSMTRYLFGASAARLGGWDLELFGRPAIPMVMTLLCTLLALGLIVAEVAGH